MGTTTFSDTKKSVAVNSSRVGNKYDQRELYLCRPIYYLVIKTIYFPLKQSIMSCRKIRLGNICIMLLTVLRTVQCTTLEYKTYEEDAPGTEIGSLSHDLKIEPGNNTQRSFRFMEEANSSLLNLGPTDGLLTVREVIDREQLCTQSERCLINFDIVAFYKEKYQLIHVEIEVIDINDHSPRFAHNESHLEISESLAVGTRFPLDIAVDQDVGNNYIQTYEVSSNNHFGIEVRAREDGVKHAELVLLQAMDRETEDAYSIQVTATDGGSPPSSGSMNVHIKVLDSNDNSPAFEHSSYKVELHEDAPIGLLLLKVKAVDPDDGINGEVVYAFVKDSPSEITRVFKIDQFSGAVTLKAAVDYETRRSYELNINAYDLGVDSSPSVCKVFVKVTDVNDNAPEIRIKPMTSMTDGVACITEAAATESFVALIRTSDRDSGSNGNVRVHLHGHEHFKLQQAYGGAVMIVTTTTLDRERNPEYNLTVEAEDLGVPPFKTIKQYTIRVSDENDNAPLFSKSVYEVSVIENNSPGSYITTVVARDLDIGDNGKVVYRLIDRDVLGGVPLSTLVSVNPVTGSLYCVRSFNYELLKLLEVNIVATDKGSPQLSGTATIRIKVVDQNDNSPYISYPVLDNDFADVPIPYNAPYGYLVLQVKARDADEGPNSELIFRILEDKNKLFSINKDSGEIVLKYGLAVMPGEILEIKIAVSDTGRLPLSKSATIRFLVREMLPSEDRITAVLPSNDEEYSSLDISLVVIIMLGGGCALLLIAILTVAVSCKHIRNCRNHEDKKSVTPGLFERSSQNIHNSRDSSVLSEAGYLVNDQTTSSLDESNSLSEERSADTETTVFFPSKSFGPENLHRKPFEQVSLWQGDKYSAPNRGPGSTDQLSVEDSGKGDSDFNDSGSDISDGCRRNPKTSCPLENSSFHPANTIAVAQQGRYCVIPNLATASCRNGYTVAFSHAPVYSRTFANPASWRDRGYGANVPEAVGSHRSRMPLRTTIPSPHVYRHKKETMMQPDNQSHQSQGIPTVHTLSEVV
ncbi:protocadherin-8-like [Anguilla rostrata]|uniref:protocadherin-8-like n=1 Tax=Anguilla rostrata TaxID=7938 RepID=UPI0030CDA561